MWDDDDKPTNPDTPTAKRLRIMTETLVPDRLTPVHVRDMYTALSQAWGKLVGEVPARNSLLLLLAHWSFETGAGRAMHCNNPGNAKHVPGDGRSYCQFRCSEIINGVEVFFDPPSPVTSFRAFDTLEAGCEDYVTLIRGTFRYAWPAVQAGDPADFCHRLKVARYYTADEAVYTRGVVGVMRYLDTQIPPDGVGIPELAQAGIESLMASFTPDHDPPPEASG